ncbi:AMP-binding protein [uncultured Zhongshania sp.]|uniref:AMP-binding protein n=1 Tax=uncultured Zhongshania sp. TaxID=1642288 RepID=UPI0025F98727|nr:AMP-binding protein [uncultured Zhongshania sp.]
MTTATQNSILSRLYHWEKTAPNAVHFVQPLGNGEVEELTWAECMDQVRRMAAYLKSLNLPDKSQIALIGKNSAHWMLADWAIWMAGHVTVPLYPTLNAETVRYILDHSEARLVFIGKLDDWEMMRGGIPKDLPGVVLPLAPTDTGYTDWATLCATQTPLAGDIERDPQEMATIVYTSGSTGQPKGVMHSFNTFRVVGEIYSKILGFDQDDRCLSYLPLAHIYERMGVEIPSCYAGFKVFFAESLQTFPADLRRARPTGFLSVPRLWTKFESAVDAKIPKKKQRILFHIPIIGKKVKHKILIQLGLQDCRFAATGSAPLPPTTVEWYRSLGLELLEGYGMSEDFGISHVTRPGESKIGYVGRPNEGVEARIEANGEIVIKSPAGMMGYFKDPEKTAESFTADGFFKTGDMGEYDAQGKLRITGRIKELFKTSKGKYVAPVPIENRLGRSSNVEVACVGGANQPATHALILLSEDLRAALDKGADRQSVEQELMQTMEETNAELDPHEHLQFLVVVKGVWTIENEFLTPTMKIKRNVIEKHYADRTDGWYSQRQKVIWE